MKKKSLLIGAIALLMSSATLANSEAIATTNGQITSITVGSEHVSIEMGGYGYLYRTTLNFECPVNVIQTKFYFDVDSDSARMMGDMAMFALDKNSRVTIVSDPNSAKVMCANEPQLITDIKLSTPTSILHSY